MKEDTVSPLDLTVHSHPQETVRKATVSLLNIYRPFLFATIVQRLFAYTRLCKQARGSSRASSRIGMATCNSRPLKHRGLGHPRIWVCRVGLVIPHSYRENTAHGKDVYSIR